MYKKAGQLERAMDLLERTLAGRRAALPAEHPSIGTSINNLALVMMGVGRQQDAARLFAEALELLRSSSPRADAPE